MYDDRLFIATIITQFNYVNYKDSLIGIYKGQCIHSDTLYILQKKDKLNAFNNFFKLFKKEWIKNRVELIEYFYSVDKYNLSHQKRCNKLKKIMDLICF